MVVRGASALAAREHTFLHLRLLLSFMHGGCGDITLSGGYVLNALSRSARDGSLVAHERTTAPHFAIARDRDDRTYCYILWLRKKLGAHERAASPYFATARDPDN